MTEDDTLVLSKIKLTPDVRPDVCTTHGAFESHNYYADRWTQCPECRSEKRKADEQVSAMLLKQQHQQAWNGKVADAGIPERFREKTLDKYRAESDLQRRAFDSARRFIEDESYMTGKNMILCGRPGTGKTHLAVSVGLAAIRQRKRVLFTTVIRAIRRVKSTWAKDAPESENEAIAALASADLLILDEVGVQFGTDSEQLILFDVINERYEKRKSTILISNLSLVDVKNYLGERIYDRLREDGGVYVPFEWESYRGSRHG